MKKQRHPNAYWTPQPGSWEEAVESHDEQIVRFRRYFDDHRPEMKVVATIEPQIVPPSLQP